LFLPFPDLLDKGLAPEFMPGNSLGSEVPFDNVLGRDSRVVGSRQPQDVKAVHSLVAALDVLESIVQCVPHVK
jgi:hypothetical protein